MNLAKIKAIEKKNKERILKLCPNVSEESGIYMFKREENGVKYAYVGQAKHLLTRLADHLRGHQHIDLSIKKHGLWTVKNTHGWSLRVWFHPVEELNDAEQNMILACARKGYQLRNKTAGGQSNGKVIIAETKPAKGYRDGLAQGYKNAQREVAKLFAKHLVFGYAKADPFTNYLPSQNERKAAEKFNKFIKGENENE